jgi:hypothetical protein
MEELASFYEKYKDWLLLGLAWLLSIPGGIITSRLDAYLRSHSLSTRERKIKALLVRYINIKNDKEHNNIRYLLNPTWWWLPFISIGLSFIIFEFIPAFTWFRPILLFIVSIPLYFFIVQIYQGLANIRDFVYFEGFKRRTLKKLIKLGCNPKDYGIE